METWVVIDDCSRVEGCGEIAVGAYSTKDRAIIEAQKLIFTALSDFGYNLDFSNDYFDDDTFVDLEKGYAYISSDYDREIIYVERLTIDSDVEYGVKGV